MPIGFYLPCVYYMCLTIMQSPLKGTNNNPLIKSVFVCCLLSKRDKYELNVSQ